MAFETGILITLKLDTMTLNQRNAIYALLKQKNVFLSIKTGGGKIFCHQGCTPSYVSMLINDGDSHWSAIGQVRSCTLMSAATFPVL